MIKLNVGSDYEFTDTDGTKYEGTLFENINGCLGFDLFDDSSVEKSIDEIKEIEEIAV
ncbi:hypothetical protein [Virgibacillus profundi]|uniref:hypothetical protein n=1 Tax=Virgibacillus profundi TaxID=2024555 RepID=UPI0013FDC7E4|nr:hypothetical protein [Virgibacillus profundi]